MTVATVVKTIGTTGIFSTPQLWEDGAPANLTTAEKSAAGTFLVAAFIQGENLSFVGSGATGKLLDTDSTGAGNGTYVTYGITTGNPAASDVVTGGTSGATCVLSSGTPMNVGVIWQGQCQNQEFSGTGTQLTISGSTVDSGSFKECTTVAGASFRDNANVQTNALRYNASNGCGIKGTSANTATLSITEANSKVNKLQFSATGAGGRAFSNSAATTPLLDFCIFEGTYVSTSAALGVMGGSASVTATNCLFVQRTSAADHIIGTGTGSPSFYNCTFAAADDLATAPVAVILSGASGTITMQNCSLFAGDTSKAIKAGSATFNFTTCYSDISGTSGVTQATYSSEFQDVNDATRDFRLKSGAAQIDIGTTDSTNASIDIAGTARPSGSAYDVGCWEFKSLAINVALTGITATGSVGTLAVNASLALSGVAGTPALGSLGPVFSVSVTGLGATGAIGTVTPSTITITDVALTGISATGSIGNIAPSANVALSGVVATGSIGTLTPSRSISITGLLATSSVGSVGVTFGLPLTGKFATTSIGSLGVTVSTTLSGIVATTIIGTISAFVSGAFTRSIERTYIVISENRTINITVEDRVYPIVVESRTL